MKHKADIDKCKIAKHPVEVEPGTAPHRKAARRMSLEKAKRANQGVRDILALGMIQPSLSPRASSIVMVKKKSGELRFCCDFRPLKEVTIKDAYPLPVWMKASQDWVKRKSTIALILPGRSLKFQYEKPTDRRLPLPVNLGF